MKSSTPCRYSAAGPATTGSSRSEIQRSAPRKPAAPAAATALETAPAAPASPAAICALVNRGAYGRTNGFWGARLSLSHSCTSCLNPTRRIHRRCFERRTSAQCTTISPASSSSSLSSSSSSSSAAAAVAAPATALSTRSPPRSPPARRLARFERFSAAPCAARVAPSAAVKSGISRTERWSDLSRFLRTVNSPSCAFTSISTAIVVTERIQSA